MVVSGARMWPNPARRRMRWSGRAAHHQTQWHVHSSGSLLSSRWDVLMAAHCLTDATGRIMATRVQSGFLPRHGGSIAVNRTQLCTPPSNDGNVSRDNAIASVRLSQPITPARHGDVSSVE
jgi:hypothetical protein